MTENAISRELSFPELFRFALPSIVMMVFMSLYTIVDGLFVSRFVGSDALSAVNIAWPLISLINAIGIMFASGGSAIVARQMGEGQEEEANRSFSLIALANVLLGTTLAALCLLFLEPLMGFLGAEGILRPLVADYLNLLLLFAPMSLFQMLFQNFFVTAGRPKLGLTLTILGGLANMVLDYVFIAVLNFGIRGAALATAMSYCIPAVGGLIFFFLLNRKGLHFTKPSRQLKLIWESCLNGSSEMVSNLSGSVTTLLFNLVMLDLAGSDGVAAITAVLYCQFLMNALFLGFSIGVSPVVSYHFGADNQNFLHKTLRSCILFTVISSALIFGIGLLGAGPIVGLFFNGGAVEELAVHGFRLFSIGFLFAGINIFGSGFFTALGNGKTSAAISFSRTFLFTVLGIIFLSRFWGMDGLWLAIPLAELLTAIFVCWLARILRSEYGLL